MHAAGPLSVAEGEGREHEPAGDHHAAHEPAAGGQVAEERHAQPEDEDEARGASGSRPGRSGVMPGPSYMGHLRRSSAAGRPGAGAAGGGVASLLPRHGPDERHRAEDRGEDHRGLAQRVVAPEVEDDRRSPCSPRR